ncbi:hypothetical protein XMD420_001066 [Marinobacterium sp. xm-d-420]|uniref:hypothetical protein n=1 Tax=Marinobacterium sp. xm-d-420 TaxID=2497737 RepID=UPI001568D1BF|nr:hypothetical protein [Marinobacterium sp. xm-d-420]NRP27462.1 hypothetical protein [Marinobacterium sp. xm-d-420]
MRASFPADYLDGDFLHTGFVIPTLVAQQIAKKYGMSEGEVRSIQYVIWASVLEWIAENAPSILPIVREYPMEELLVDVHFWGQLNVQIVDLLDAVLILSASGNDSQMISKTFDTIKQEKIFAALILLGSDVASRKPISEFKGEYIRLASMVNKSYSQLTILDDGPFVPTGTYLNSIKSLQNLMAQGNQYMGKSGGDGKGESYEPMRELLEKLINEARPKNMEEAANMFHDQIVEFDRFNKALFSKTGDTHRAIKRQISLLNNAGRLYKKF